MAFHEQRIDLRVTNETRFVVRHPSRVKLYDATGQLEGQQFGPSPPVHRVNLAHGIKTEAQFQELVDTFYVVMFTPYDGLRVRNPSDFKATVLNTTVEAIGGGTYQLQRKHTFGGVTVARDITKPISAVVVYDASDTPLVPTVNYNTGTFTVAAGTPAKWSGLFDTPMTFEADDWEAQLEASEGGVLRISRPIWMEEVRGT
jgi:uncharacterized protein (TIGR02217 family)